MKTETRTIYSFGDGPYNDVMGYITITLKESWSLENFVVRIDWESFVYSTFIPIVKECNYG